MSWICDSFSVLQLVESQLRWSLGPGGSFLLMDVLCLSFQSGPPSRSAKRMPSPSSSGEEGVRIFYLMSYALDFQEELVSLDPSLDSLLPSGMRSAVVS